MAADKPSESGAPASKPVVPVEYSKDPVKKRLQEQGIDATNKEQMKIPEKAIKVTQAWAETHPQHPLSQKLKGFAFKENADTAVKKIIELQKSLGFKGDDVDGIMGPKTAQAYMGMIERTDAKKEQEEARKILGKFEGAQNTDIMNRKGAIPRDNLTADGKKLIAETNAAEKAKEEAKKKTETEKAETEKALKDKVDQNPKVIKAREGLTKAEQEKNDANDATGKVAEKLDAATKKNEKIKTDTEILTKIAKDSKENFDKENAKLEGIDKQISEKRVQSGEIAGKIGSQQAEIDRQKNKLDEMEKKGTMDEPEYNQIEIEIDKLEKNTLEMRKQKNNLDLDISKLSGDSDKLKPLVEQLRVQKEATKNALKEYTNKNKPEDINKINGEAGAALLRERAAVKAIDPAKKALEAAIKEATTEAQKATTPSSSNRILGVDIKNFLKPKPLDYSVPPKE